MIFWTDVSLNSLHFIVLKKFHINVMSTYQKLTISFIKKKVQIKMLHIIIIIIVCNKPPPIQVKSHAIFANYSLLLV